MCVMGWVLGFFNNEIQVGKFFTHSFPISPKHSRLHMFMG